jgi:hypothetical protein
MGSIWFWLAAIGASVVLAFASYFYTVLARASASAIKHPHMLPPHHR